MSLSSRRLVRRVGGGLWLLLLLAGTLTPGSDPGPSIPDWSSCLLCGQRGAADAVLNVLLFVPLGLLLDPMKSGRWESTDRRSSDRRSSARWSSARWSSAIRALGIGLVLSAGIESAQLWIPGRHSSPGDLLFNSLGTGLGAWIAGRPLLPGPTAGVASRLRSAGWTTFALTYMAATGLLWRPSTTDGLLYGQWTPGLGGYAQYDGRVVEARVDGMTVPSRRIPESGQRELRHLLEEGADLLVEFEVGRPTREPAPIFNIADGDQRFLLSLAAVGPDLTLWRRYRADDLRLDRPHHRLRGALGGFVPGDTTRVRAEPLADGGYRIEVGGPGVSGGERSVVRTGHTLGRSWALLHSAPDWLPWGRAVDLLWLAVLGIPIGMWARSVGALVVQAGVVAGALALVPTLTSVVTTPGPEYVALVLGVLLGRAVRVMVATGSLFRRARGSPPARAGPGEWERAP